MTDFLGGDIHREPLWETSQSYQIPVGDPTRKSVLHIRADGDAIWLTTGVNASSWPAGTTNAFLLISGTEYVFEFPAALIGDDDPTVYAVTTSTTATAEDPVFVNWLVTYKD